MNAARAILEDALRAALMPEQAVVVAVSGGPDSVALLRAVTTREEVGRGLRAPPHPANIIVAHLEHGLRAGDGLADMQWVEQLAGNLGLRFVGERTELDLQGRSVEEAARDARYEFLARVAREHNAQTVFTGHTRDDQIETVLLRILRGTGLKGLSGIPPRRPIRYGSSIDLVRPLLGISREQILAYLSDLDQHYRTDATNTDPAYTRNRVRHEMLPQLREKFGGSVDNALFRLTAAAAEAHALVARLAAEAFPRLASVEDRRVALHVDALCETDPAIATELIAHTLGPHLGRPEGFPFEAVQAVLALARRKTSGGQVHLPGRVTARREYGKILIESRPPKDRGLQPPAVAGAEETIRGLKPPVHPRGEPFASTLIVIDGETVVGDFRVTTRTLPAADFDLAAFLAACGPLAEAFDAARIGPLAARPRCPGDRYTPLGMTGSRKVKDILIDRKVPRPEREKMLIFETDSGIVWPTGCPLAAPFKITPATRRILTVKVSDQ